MPRPIYRSQVLRDYLIHMVLRDLILPLEDLEGAVAQLGLVFLRDQVATLELAQ